MLILLELSAGIWWDMHHWNTWMLSWKASFIRFSHEYFLHGRLKKFYSFGPAFQLKFFSTRILIWKHTVQSWPRCKDTKSWLVASFCYIDFGWDFLFLWIQALSLRRVKEKQPMCGSAWNREGWVSNKSEQFICSLCKRDGGRKSLHLPTFKFMFHGLELR